MQGGNANQSWALGPGPCTFLLAWQLYCDAYPGWHIPVHDLYKVSFGMTEVIWVAFRWSCESRRHQWPWREGAVYQNAWDHWTVQTGWGVQVCLCLQHLAALSASLLHPCKACVKDHTAFEVKHVKSLFGTKSNSIWSIGSGITYIICLCQSSKFSQLLCKKAVSKNMHRHSEGIAEHVNTWTLVLLVLCLYNCVIYFVNMW